VSPSEVAAHGVVDPLAPLLLGRSVLGLLLIVDGMVNLIQEPVDKVQLLLLVEGALGGRQSRQDASGLSQQAHETWVIVELHRWVLHLLLQLVDGVWPKLLDRLVGLEEDCLEPAERL
jgi:EAL domain-containing protein (putative c-di-GMP-specific phosphodiesterase class I)